MFTTRIVFGGPSAPGPRIFAAIHLEQMEATGRGGSGGTRAQEGEPLTATAAAVRIGRIAGATEKALAPASMPSSTKLATRIFAPARVRVGSLIDAAHVN